MDKKGWNGNKFIRSGFDSTLGVGGWVILISSDFISKKINGVKCHFLMDWCDWSLDQLDQQTSYVSCDVCRGKKKKTTVFSRITRISDRPMYHKMTN